MAVDVRLPGGGAQVVRVGVAQHPAPLHRHHLPVEPARATQPRPLKEAAPHTQPSTKGLQRIQTETDCRPASNPLLSPSAVVAHERAVRLQVAAATGGSFAAAVGVQAGVGVISDIMAFVTTSSFCQLPLWLYRIHRQKTPDLSLWLQFRCKLVHTGVEQYRHQA